MAATPTYSLYRIATAQVGSRFVAIGRSSPDFAFPVDEVVDAARRAEIVWLCEPNNPAGDRLDGDGLEAVIAATDGVVVIDAAYAEFAGDRWGPAVLAHHNLLVMHTLSKAYGLAGARVGYAVGHPDLVSALDRVRPPGSIASLSVDAAVAALGMSDRLATTVAAITAARDDLAQQLGDLRFRVLPSATNFVLCEVGTDAKALAEATRSEGMVLRTYSDDGPLAGYLRFTARDARAHDRLIDCLRRNLS